MPSLSSAFAAQSRNVSTADRDHSRPRLSATSRATVPSANRLGFQSAGNLNGFSFGSVERARFGEGEAFVEVVCPDVLSAAAAGVTGNDCGGAISAGARRLRGAASSGVHSLRG
jgi:hypothetical protein